MNDTDNIWRQILEREIKSAENLSKQINDLLEKKNKLLSLRRDAALRNQEDK